MDPDSFERELDLLPREQTMLLPALLLAQEREGFVSDAAIRRIAGHLRLTASEVDGIATAYPDLLRAAPDNGTIRVCTGVACHCAGADTLLARLRAMTARTDGDAHPLEIEETACLFLCAVAPAVAIDGRGHGRVTPDALEHLVAGIVEVSP